MTERFTLTNPKNAFQEMKCGIDDRGNTLTFNEVVDMLNAFNDENEQLKHNNRMLSIKMSEVYTKYCLLNEFSEDTNPNDAVKRVLSELMQITKEYR